MQFATRVIHNFTGDIHSLASIAAMARAAAEGDVGLLGPGLGRAAPFESAIHHRMHLVEPPACAGRAAGANIPAGSCAVFLKSKFHLVLHMRKNLAGGVGHSVGEAK